MFCVFTFLISLFALDEDHTHINGENHACEAYAVSSSYLSAQMSLFSD